MPWKTLTSRDLIAGTNSLKIWSEQGDPGVIKKIRIYASKEAEDLNQMVDANGNLLIGNKPGISNQQIMPRINALVDGISTASFAAEESARIAADAINAQSITDLAVTVNNPVTGLNATSQALGSLTTRVSTTENSIISQSEKIVDLESAINNPISGVAATASAVSTLNTKVTDATTGVTANSNAITSLQAVVNNPTTGVTATSAALVVEQGVRAAADTAQSSSITTLNSTVGGHTTSIQTATSSIDGIQGKHTVKIDNNGYITGYGLISTNNNATPTSEFTVLADKFMVITPGKVAKVPFIVGTVNGASQVGINGDLLVDGTIKAVAIAAGSVTADKVAALAITAGKISVTNLAAISANVGTITAGRLQNAGNTTYLDLNANTLALGSALTWNGTQLSVSGSISITSGTGFSNLTDRPTSLSAINSTEATKLTGIATGATVGATWGTNLTGQPANSELLNSQQTYTAITGTKPPVDADKTSLNIAAGFTGQGALATRATVGLTHMDSTMITSSKIATGLVAAGSIMANAVTANAIEAGAIVAGKIAAGAISASNIAAGTITADRIVVGTLTYSQLANGTLTNKATGAGTTSASAAINRVGGDIVLIYAGGYTRTGVYGGPDNPCTTGTSWAQIRRGTTSGSVLRSTAEEGQCGISVHAVCIAIDVPGGTGSQMYTITGPVGVGASAWIEVVVLAR